jgi:hypothetical protein
MKPSSMTSLRYLSVLVCCLSATIDLSGADQPSLAPQLEPLRPLLDKTWKGPFKSSTPEKPVVDIMRWERALNGKAIRVLHSVNDGSYGGETIFKWDEKKQAVTYHYFTTAGFMTVGTVSFKDAKVITREVVSGSTGGVTEVRGTSELLPGGEFRVKTEHLKNGEWQPGREVTYTQDPTAKIIFK